MRVLFTACPLFGHVNTILPLALRPSGVGSHERPLRPTLPTAPDDRLPDGRATSGRPLVHLALGTIYHASDVLAAAAAGLREEPAEPGPTGRSQLPSSQPSEPASSVAASGPHEPCA